MANLTDTLMDIAKDIWQNIGPGYNEVVTRVSAINQRGGIWKINVVNLDVGGFDPLQNGWENAGFDLYKITYATFDSMHRSHAAVMCNVGRFAGPR